MRIDKTFPTIMNELTQTGQSQFTIRTVVGKPLADVSVDWDGQVEGVYTITVTRHDTGRSADDVDWVPENGEAVFWIEVGLALAKAQPERDPPAAGVDAAGVIRDSD